MGLDQFKNFAKVTVSTGYDAAATSIVLSSGHGAKLPTAPFNVVWWNSTDYPDPADDPNVEIVRVTNIATDTLTVTRGQESIAATTKNASGRTYKMIAGVTAKSLVTDMASVGFKDAMTLKSADIASAATTDLSTATGELVDITGTATITALGTLAAGIERVLRFNGTLTLTHNATSLILPGAANTTTANKDIAIFRSLGSGNWLCVSYFRNAAPPVSGTNTGDNSGTAIFGDGSDGALIYDGSTTILGMAPAANVYTLTRDIYATNLTVNAGVTIKTASFRIFANGTVTLVTGSPGGVIQANGNNGSGVTAGAALAAATAYNGSAAGGNGGTNAAGTNGPNATTSIGGGGGAGGSATNAGGTAGATTAAGSGSSMPRNFWEAAAGKIGQSGNYKGGAGGGGGGSNNASAIGGGGGGGAGIVGIFAKSIVVNTGATISANGGNGANGTGGTGNAGGGGGGGGGGVILVYSSYTNSGTVSANGGVKGLHNAQGGNDGNDGSNGVVITINNNA